MWLLAPFLTIIFLARRNVGAVMLQLRLGQRARGSLELKLPYVCMPGSAGCFVSSEQYFHCSVCLSPTKYSFFFFFMPADKPPVFGACKRLDIELEMVRWAFFPCHFDREPLKRGKRR